VFETYEDAVLARELDTDMVCGVRMEDESARYFLMPCDAPDDVVADRAFEIRNGRPVSNYERVIRELAERRTVDA
jgi:hypothetical protein